jgi:hypothetical protein
MTSFSYNGTQYTLPTATQEEIDGFTGYARQAYKANGVVFACMAVRMRLFRQARFVWQRLNNGVGGDNFYSSAVDLLETPWPGATTADLLGRMIQYADLAGNAFVIRNNGRLVVLRPDWVTIVAGSPNDIDGDEPIIWDPDAEVLQYLYTPGGPASGEEPIAFDPSVVAHFAPIPDPEARFRGMSWLTPIAREVMADKAALDHKLMFFENGATPQMVVKLDVPDLEKFKRWIDHFETEHDGAANAYKTLYLGAGADATVVGADLRQLDFKIVQGAGETRIAAAAGVPPVIVGLSEGLQAATYSNYGQARRAFADVTMRDLWQDVCGSLQPIIDAPPTGGPARLWYDDCIPFLQDDELDRANIFAVDATAFNTLVTGGVTPESAAAAVAAKDITLVEHTGLYSVQLQPPGSTDPEPDPGDTNEPNEPAEPSTNGSGNHANVPAPA